MACADREVSFASAEADAWRGAPWKADFDRRGGLRPAVGLRVSFASAEADAWRGAPWKADFNRRGGLRPAVGLRRPKGWSLRRRRPTPGAQAPWKADFNRCEGLRPTVGLRRPGGCLLRRRRPTPGAQRPGRPISIGVKAFGWRSACTPNEFGPQGPSADGRPAPTGKVSFVSAEADARRGAPWKADFNRREGLRPAISLCAE